jgi:hypothetical protein
VPYPGEVLRLTNAVRLPLAESFPMFLWHKFVPSAAAMLIVLTGCQTPGTFISGEQALKSFPPECTMRASIPADSTVMEIEELKGAVERAGIIGPSYAGFHAFNRDGRHSQMCLCGKNWEMSKMSQLDAQNFVNELMKGGEWDQTKGEFDRSSVPAQYEFAGKRISFEGDYLIKGKMLFKNTCMMAFSAATKANSIASADRFIASIHDVQANVLPQTATDAAGRLRTLQGLRDQRLITQEEYETQRKEILSRL